MKTTQFSCPRNGTLPSFFHLLKNGAFPLKKAKNFHLSIFCGLKKRPLKCPYFDGQLCSRFEFLPEELCKLHKLKRTFRGRLAQ